MAGLESDRGIPLIWGQACALLQIWHRSFGRTIQLQSVSPVSGFDLHCLSFQLDFAPQPGPSSMMRPAPSAT